MATRPFPWLGPGHPQRTQERTASPASAPSVLGGSEAVAEPTPSATQAAAPREVVARPPTHHEVVRSFLEQGRADEAAQVLSVLHVADAARLVARLEPERAAPLVASLPPVTAARILERLDSRDAIAIALGLPIAARAAVLDQASPDVAADVLRGLSPEERQRSISIMARARDVAPLLRYEDESAGGLMVPDFATLREWMTAEEAIFHLRGSTPPASSSNYLFVLDRRNALTGVVNLRDLVIAKGETQVRELMNRNVITVTPGTDQEECARLMARYDLAQLPVANERGQVLGVILAEDMIDVVQAQADEDMLRLAGIGSDAARILGPFRRAFRTRLPWLLVNLGTVVMTAAVISVFEATIARAAFLAVLLPMVSGQGAIAGTQTLTLITRGLALGELTLVNAAKALRREVVLGLANGVVFGLIAGGLAWAWKGDGTLGVVVGLAMVLNMVIAGLFGAIIPLALKALRQDPALGSAVILTTVTDVAAFLSVLGLAAWWVA